jgi:AcrR family transcriptional regulator
VTVTSTVSAKRRGRPPRLTRQAVVDAAVALTDELGFDGVTVRRLASHLEVAPFALYGYVRDKDELLDLVVAELVQRSDSRLRRLPASPSAEQVLTAYGEALFELLCLHPAFLDAFLRGPIVAPRVVSELHAAISAVLDAGMSRSRAVDAFVTVREFVVGFVSVDLGRARSGTRREPVDAGNDAAGEVLRRLQDNDRAEQFRRSLTLVVRGVCA